MLINRYSYWGVKDSESAVSNIIAMLERNEDSPDHALEEARRLPPFDHGWDELYGKYREGQTKTTYELMIEPYLKDANVIADIGAGRLGLAKYIGVHNPDKVIYGTDVAEYNGSATLPHNVIFARQTNSSRLPLEDHSIDVLILSKVLHHIDVFGFDHFVQELHRVLKPDGRIILNEVSYSQQIQYNSQNAEISLMDRFMELIQSQGDSFCD